MKFTLITPLSTYVKRARLCVTRYVHQMFTFISSVFILMLICGAIFEDILYRYLMNWHMYVFWHHETQWAVGLQPMGPFLLYCGEWACTHCDPQYFKRKWSRALVIWPLRIRKNYSTSTKERSCSFETSWFAWPNGCVDFDVLSVWCKRHTIDHLWSWHVNYIVCDTMVVRGCIFGTLYWFLYLL